MRIVFHRKISYASIHKKTTAFRMCSPSYFESLLTVPIQACIQAMHLALCTSHAHAIKLNIHLGLRSLSIVTSALSTSYGCCHAEPKQLLCALSAVDCLGVLKVLLISASLLNQPFIAIENIYDVLIKSRVFYGKFF